MPAKPLSDIDAQKSIDALAMHGGNAAAAARYLQVNEKTFIHRLKVAHNRGLKPTPIKGFTVAKTGEDLRPVTELIQERIAKFDHLRKFKDQRKLIRVKVNVDGPIGIAHFGDPHVDDDGTDLAMIQDHVNVINRTEALFGANIGDSNNNWTGRLARLYAEQSTSAAEAWQLAEWFLRSVDWIYVLGGNHGAWSGAGDPVKWILENCQGVFDNYQARLELEFPNGKRIRVNARHDFAGHSMWNAAHGPAKAAKMGWRDHILTCGHTHVSGYQIEKDPSSGLISHCLRIASYKTFDRYAHERGLPNQDAFCNVVTVIDPRWPDDDPRLIQPIFHVESGADYLTWLRNRK